MRDANVQLEKYCKHDIAEFKKKFLSVLHSVIEEKKYMEAEFASLTLMLSQSKGIREREDGLLKAAMYHVRNNCYIVIIIDITFDRLFIIV